MIPKPEACGSCPLYGSGHGFSRLDGEGSYGVLMVGEALGADEEAAGVAFVGRAGHSLFSSLNRVDLHREGFLIFNVVACRPPDNKLTGMPYEAGAIAHCAPNLDVAIETARSVAASHGRTFTILTLGRTAFKRVLGLHEGAAILKEDYLNYVHWSETYHVWVVAADHPSFIMRGNHHLLSTNLQYPTQRAVEVAQGGFSYTRQDYLLDPSPSVFTRWVEECLVSTPPILSCDIETPMKQGRDEEEVAREADEDFTILRHGFSYREGEAISVAHSAEYLPALMRLYRSPVPKLGWNWWQYDAPRVRATLPLTGVEHDGMYAYHVLNSATPKGLGYVTPLFARRFPMWKHLSGNRPAFYNACDADSALRCWNGIVADLQTHQLWPVYDRHVAKVDQVLKYMTTKGLLLDQQRRDEAEAWLTERLAGLQRQMETVIPDRVRAWKSYQRTPKDTTGMVQRLAPQKVKVCPSCNAINVKAKHFRSIGKKRLKSGETENPCIGFEPTVQPVDTPLWSISLPFKISIKSLTAYQGVRGHKPIIDRRAKRVTFDEGAIRRLCKTYPTDPLYPLIAIFKRHQHTLTAYVGVTEDK